VPALSAAEIVRAVEDAFTESTAVALLVSQARAHPKRFYVTAGESSFPVWIYVWILDARRRCRAPEGRIPNSVDVGNTATP
jgi:hypothetical protein